MAQDPAATAALFDADEYRVHLSLTDRFVIPPFTVLDTRQGYWRDRKREWMTLGIESELGRGEKLAYNIGEWDEYRDREARAPAPRMAMPDLNASPALGAKWTRRQADERTNVTGAPDLPDYADNGMAKMAPGTSIFDPVLCEIAYRWHTPDDAPVAPQVLDPFAGGSVRGLTAAILGRAYTGIELRPEQVDANRTQVGTVLEPFPHAPVPAWHEGDATEADLTPAGDHRYDMVFSCPPYADLEVYSDDPRDLSNMDYPAFLEGYRTAIARAAEMLRPDRFAVWVIGEARHRKHGHAYGLIADTVNAFRDAGMPLYNEAILVNVVGTLALRVTRQFEVSRKMGRCHQHVLVFVKGDARAATAYAEGRDPE